MKKSARLKRIEPWLEVLATLAWGGLLLKYWLTGELNILIHPNYFALTIAGGIGLLLVGSFKVLQLLNVGKRKGTFIQAEKHIALFPPGWSSGLLLGAAILGFTFTPQVFASDKAVREGVTDFLPVTQTQPKAFRSATKPEDRSLIEWVRTLTVYPEPDAYAGQKVKVKGFAIHLDELPEEYLLLARFVITCCAADAYPVGLPVKLKGSRDEFPPDTWLEVEGQMKAETFGDNRKLTIETKSIQVIPKPKNPYDTN
ncbi:MAG: TIGR03943 family protein [Oscillatoria sp. SIO1A7]|nr:TIGR03943 family protein [Oscillatoria sp. SIO1A7]